MGRGQKKCPECGNTTGPRSFHCPKCNHKFEKRESKITSSHGRGKKTCPDCMYVMGVRCRQCDSCGFKFEIKTHTDRILPNQITEWESLTTGTKIRVVGGSGPYFQREDGDKQYTTNRGKYIVHSITETGINVIGDLLSKSADAGFSFLYMGAKTKSPICNNLWRDACKIVKV